MKALVPGRWRPYRPYLARREADYGPSRQRVPRAFRACPEARGRPSAHHPLASKYRGPGRDGRAASPRGAGRRTNTCGDTDAIGDDAEGWSLAAPTGRPQWYDLVM